MDVNQIKGIISGLLNQVPGIKSVSLFTDDGLPILSTLENGEEETRSMAAAALICDAGVRGTTELDLGQFDSVITLAEQGYFILRRVTQGKILMAIAEPDVVLGLAMVRTKRAAQEIMNLVEAD